MKAALEKYATGELVNQRAFLDFLQERRFRTNTTKTKGRKLYGSYFQKLTTPRRLYFYAGKIIYPKYDIYEPIPAMHKALIDEQTMMRLFKRLQEDARPKVNLGNHPKEYRLLSSILKCGGCHKPMYGVP